VEALVAAGLEEHRIGVISPYRAQLRLLRDRLGARPAVEVLTVDRSQGRQKACIILSLVRSNSMHNVGDLLRDWRRVNVAITRAELKLVVLGSRSTLETSSLFSIMNRVLAANQWIVRLPKDAHRHHEGMLRTRLSQQQQPASPVNTRDAPAAAIGGGARLLFPPDTAAPVPPPDQQQQQPLLDNNNNDDDDPYDDDISDESLLIAIQADLEQEIKETLVASAPTTSNAADALAAADDLDLAALDGDDGDSCVAMDIAAEPAQQQHKDEAASPRQRDNPPNEGGEEEDDDTSWVDSLNLGDESI